MGGSQGFILKHLDNGFIRWLAGGMVAGASPSMNAMLRNTISLTKLNSGYKINVIPEKAVASFDIRLLPETDPREFLSQLENVINDNRVKVIPHSLPAQGFVSEWDTPFFVVLEEHLTTENPEVIVSPFMTIGGTDSKWFQERGVNTYGLIPALLTESEINTIHGIDERISVENLMLGVRVVYRTAKELCE